MKSSVIGVATIASLALSATAIAAGTQTAAAATSPHYVYSTVIVHVNGKACAHIQMAGINDFGTTVGTVFCDGASRGFKRTPNGVTVKFRAPGAATLMTQTSGISSNGTVSLYSYNAKTKEYASYLRAPSGKMTAITNPLAGPGGTRVLAVNASQEAVGVYYTNAKKSVLAPFVMKGGTVRAFSLGVNGATNVILTGVTDNGVVSGQFSGPNKTVRGFLFRGGKATIVKVPGAPVARKRGSGVTNIAKGEIITGDVYTKTSVTGFVGKASHFTTVRVPSAFSTFCQGVNAHDTVVGFYLTRKDTVRGFVARLSS